MSRTKYINNSDLSITIINFYRKTNMPSNDIYTSEINLIHKDIIIPKTKHALIRIAKHILNVDETIYQSHIFKLSEIILEHLKSGMSPNDIKNHYKINYSDFGMFIKSSLKIKLKSYSESVNNYFTKIGRKVTDEKSLYFKQCSFKFDPYSMPELPGYELLLKFGIYHSVKNKFGVCRDHIISKENGWRNKIDARLISHPANCQFLTNLDNILKSTKSYITVDELLKRIDTEQYSKVLKNDSKHLSKTLEHRQKISETNKKYMLLTNGITNIRIPKTDPIPLGYRRGMTRNKHKLTANLNTQQT